MKPEMILQSSLLDILFYKRNKAYGAYMLRKGYSSRLNYSMLITFSVVFLLSIWKLTSNPNLQKSVIAKYMPMDEVYIREIKLPDEPKEAMPVKPVAPKKVAQVANPTFKIVPDELAVKNIKTVDELDKKLIGLADVDGIDDVGTPPELPSTGGGKGMAVVVAKPEVPKVEPPLTFAEEMPEFPGGKDAFLKFMQRHLKHPENLEGGEKVVVRVKFVVDAQGTIKNIQVIQSGGILDAEVIRVVNKMPKWRPGKQNGTFVPVYFQLPVTFVGLSD